MRLLSTALSMAMEGRYYDGLLSDTDALTGEMPMIRFSK